MIAALLLSTAFAAGAAGLPVAGATTGPAPASRTAQTSVGRDLSVLTPVTGNVVAILANVRIADRVSGNVIVWGGRVEFLPGGSVDGNLSVFGGDIAGEPGRPLPVAGAVSTPGSLLRLYLEEMHHVPWEDAARRPATRGLRVMALGLWLLASLLLLYAFGSPFARAAAAASEDRGASLLAGALGVLSLFLAAAAALALLPAALGVPIALLLAALAVAAKIFGMAAIFLLVGQKLLKDVSPGKRPLALAVGFAVVGGASLVPFVGALLWSVASIVAVGIAFASRFGTPRVRVVLPA